jgi:hypothetical protein
MRRVWVISGVVAVVPAGTLLATAASPPLRVSAIETLCEMGLPNLSRCGRNAGSTKGHSSIRCSL